MKERLVAYQGKLVTVVEQLGGAIPNGSGWVVTTAPAPALDSTNLVVGHVTQGFDVVQQIAALPVVRANKGSPFLKVWGTGILNSHCWALTPELVATSKHPWISNANPMV